MLSLMGGLSIFIGFLCYNNCYNVIGAIVFSVGLYLVLWNNYNLFTGKIGYCRTLKSFKRCFFILIGNILGCLPALLFSIPVERVQDKISQPFYLVFFKAFLCGLLIYTAVELYNKGTKIAPLLIVPSFILSGAEHCIADICFIFSTHYWSWDSLFFIILVILGNSIGSLFLDFLKNFCYNNNIIREVNDEFY